MAYTQVERGYFESEEILSLPIIERMLLVYLMTIRNNNICGIYYFPAPKIAKYLNITKKELRKIMEKNEEDGVAKPLPSVRYYVTEEVVWIKELFGQSYQNLQTRQKKGVLNVLDAFEEKIQKKFLIKYHEILGVEQPPNKEFKKYFRTIKTEINSFKKNKNSTEITVDPDPGFAEFWEFSHNKTDQRRAEEAWAEAMKKGVKPETLINAMKKYYYQIKRQAALRGEFPKNMMTFKAVNFIKNYYQDYLEADNGKKPKKSYGI